MIEDLFYFQEQFVQVGHDAEFAASHCICAAFDSRKSGGGLSCETRPVVELRASDEFNLRQVLHDFNEMLEVRRPAFQEQAIFEIPHAFLLQSRNFMNGL